MKIRVLNESGASEFFLPKQWYLGRLVGATVHGPLAAVHLFHLQDGGVGLHDGHDDFVNVILESVVNLFLFVDSFHKLQTERPKSVENIICIYDFIPVT